MARHMELHTILFLWLKYKPLYIIISAAINDKKRKELMNENVNNIQGDK